MAEVVEPERPMPKESASHYLPQDQWDAVVARAEELAKEDEQ